MASKQGSRPTKKGTAAKPAQKAAPAKNARKLSDPKPEPVEERHVERILDDKTKRDIWGVVCLLAAAVLFIIMIIPSGGIVSTWLSTTLHLALGIGSYLLPLFLLLVAIALFAKQGGYQVPARVAIGLMLLFVTILVLSSLYTPGVSSSMLDPLFATSNLVEHGGYLGAGISWVLMLLFGRTVSTIIAIGAAFISLIVIGFSITDFADRMRKFRRDSFAEREETFADMPAVGMVPRASERSAAGKQGRRPSPVREARTERLGDDEDQEAASPDTQVTRRLNQSQAKTAPVAPKKKPAAPKEPASTTLSPAPSEGFELPSMALLASSGGGKRKTKESDKSLRNTAMLLQETLADFGVAAQVVGWVAGPTVTLFKVDLPPGVRVSKITNLQDDIALALAAVGVRIFAPIPGTNYVGIEVPNLKPQTVLLGDVLAKAGPGPLQMVIGEDVEGNYVIDDLSKMPHLLVAGTTGSGKSVAINGMIMSILMRATPAEVRFIMIDPKRVEFTPYNGIPHLYVPVVTECREAASALSWAVAEMERRLKLFASVGARKIGEYNSKAAKGMKIGDSQAEQLPFIVIVIDELADLMMNVGKEVEFSISRIAQLARAAGIHMIIATQRPSTNIVTGLIKANITCRIALNVASGIDSRVILDQTGAENLIGNGDMLFSKPEYPKPVRLQGCFTSPEEIEGVVEHLKAQGDPEYHNEILQTNLITLDSASSGGGGSSGADDPLLWEAAEIVVNSGLGSTSNIQRRLSVGYSRAGRIMDMLEEKGVVGPPNGSKPREVLVDAMELESLKAFEMNDSDTGE